MGEPTFLLAKFNEWISVTRARLKAGPSHPLDILITIATVAVGAFFFLVIASQLPIPGRRSLARGRKKKTRKMMKKKKRTRLIMRALKKRRLDMPNLNEVV